MFLLISSCVLMEDKLSLPQTKNESSALRLDGIYICEDSLDIVDLFYLYGDGTILSRGSVLKQDLESKLTKLETTTDDKYKSMKFLWGRYIIDGKIIKFEKWAKVGLYG